MTVSAAFLVKDPPVDRLVALVEYLRPVVQQFVVVVDDRTAAETVELIASWRDVEVVPFRWVDDFSEARNTAIPHCTGKWILHLDPDELPSRAMLDFIDTVGNGEQQEDVRWAGALYPAPKGYLFFTKNYFDGRQGEEWEEHWHCRLFRRECGVWYKPVHEQIMLDGLPESRTRGTPWMPKAPRAAYLIHSRMEDTRDEVYVRIEQAAAAAAGTAPA